MSICPIQLSKQCDEASQAVEALLSTLMRDKKFTNVDHLVTLSVELNAIVNDVKASLEEELREDD